MGLLSFFSKNEPEPLEKLPSGSFRISATGEISASTIPGGYPREILKEIGEMFVQAFRTAQEQGIPLKELNLDYAGAKITGREARGGAVVFLTPRKF